MIRDFTDLEVWQESHKLVLYVYKVTKEFPKEELFGLISQSRRAAVSITSNIVEGFGRSTRKDKINFYQIAKSSLGELRSQMLIARDLSFVPSEQFNAFEAQAVRVDKLLTGFIRSAQDKQ